MNDLGLAFGRGKAIGIPFSAAVLFTLLAMIGLSTVITRAKEMKKDYPY